MLEEALLQPRLLLLDLAATRPSAVRHPAVGRDVAFHRVLAAPELPGNASQTPAEDGAVGGWVIAPPPGRSALLGEPGPRPRDGAKRGAPSAKASSWCAAGPKAMGANSHDEDGEQRRHPEQEEHDEQHGEDEWHGHVGTRARRAGRGHVEERGRDGSARWRRSRLEHDAERQASHWKAVAPDIVVVGATPDVEHRTFVVGDPPGPERRLGLLRRQREHSRATDVHDMTGARLRSKRTGQSTGSGRAPRNRSKTQGGGTCRRNGTL